MGLAIRAVAQDGEAAMMMGVNKNLVIDITFKFFGYDFVHHLGRFHLYANYYYFIFIIVVLALLASHRFFNSWVGLTLSTIRDDEIAARCCGVNAKIWKLIAFVTGNFFMGVAGAFYAHMIGFISPPNFQFVESLVIVSIVILGGMDNILGLPSKNGLFYRPVQPQKDDCRSKTIR